MLKTHLIAVVHCEYALEYLLPTVFRIFYNLAYVKGYNDRNML